MSFIVPSQRSFQHSELSTQNQSNRIHNMPPTSFDSYPVPPLPNSSIQQQTPQSQLQNGTQPSFVADHPATNLPKVGETRCYWTLLSADLHFIYLDPVLASHLGEQADSLVGKSVLDFVHPDEQTSAKHDLGNVLDTRTLHGSITRVRYSRLSRVRRQLGYQGPPPGWTDADKIAVDANYMAVDIVINWAAEGLVLCFIHAVVDLSPNDNDEQNKTGWTNWCGTPSMSVEQIQLVYRRLLVCIPQTGNTRVFQILSNQPGRPLLMNWPPDQGQGPTGRDFAKFVEDVQIGTGLPSGNDAKTSCTRRYRATQNISAAMSEVESIFIPHGTVIFACHKVNSASRSTTSTNTTMQQMGYNHNSYVSQQNQQYYEQGSPYVLPPLPSSSSSSTSYNYIPQQSQPIPAQYSPPHWSQGGEPPNSQPQYATWNSPSPAHSISPLPSTASNVRSGSYPPSQSQQWSTQSSSSYMEDDSPMAQGSPSYGYTTGESETASASPTNDVVPPPRRRVSPGTTRDQYGPGGRSAGNRPMGVLKCSSCKATQSPEWRKGPSGKKELCNACGLRYARSRAKKEGHNLTQRRRKDKGLAVTKRESATPPVSTPPSYSSNRRNDYDDPPFMSPSSAGSGSGSEVYSHSGHPTLDNLTPSPSPPAANMSFVHYSPHSHHSQNQQVDSRQHYPNTSSFYSVPSPLSNPPVIHQHGNQPSVPRLEQVSAYSDRLSPTSPISQSPLTSTMPPASFERDRERDRELPPTPISAEPRHVGRRSILTHQ